jgi:hypothetical protein
MSSPKPPIPFFMDALPSLRCYASLATYPSDTSRTTKPADTRSPARVFEYLANTGLKTSLLHGGGYP